MNKMSIKSYQKNIRKILIFSAFFLLISCNSNRTTIPEMPVRLEFSITNTAPELFAFGGFKEFTVPQNASQHLGYGGILVFHTVEDKFYAFDMSCPFEAQPNIRVHADNAGIARCDSCQSSFYVGDGNALLISGKAKSPLKRYTVYYNSATLSIFVTN
jgi:nitrite reductase/ring-hydroxylating ferredoxin subunit